MTAHVQKMQMVTGCGRGISGMAKNHIKTNMGCNVVKNGFKVHLTSGTTKTVVPKIQRFNARPVLRQGRAYAKGRGGGV